MNFKYDYCSWIITPSFLGQFYLWIPSVKVFDLQPYFQYYCQTAEKSKVVPYFLYQHLSLNHLIQCSKSKNGTLCGHRQDNPKIDDCDSFLLPDSVVFKKELALCQCSLAYEIICYMITTKYQNSITCRGIHNPFLYYNYRKFIYRIGWSTNFFECCYFSYPFLGHSLEQLLSENWKHYPSDVFVSLFSSNDTEDTSGIMA